MNRVAGATHTLLTVLTIFAFSACGNKQPTAPAETTQGQTPAAAAQPAAEAPAANEPSKEPATTAATPATPAESVSETEDGDVAPATGEAPATTVQPSLRLGGAAGTAATSSEFKEGTHYVKLVPAQPTSVAPGKIEVVEIFWYGCPHCFALDPAIEAWRKGKPAYVEFTRVPSMWNDTTRLHARVFYTTELLGKTEELHTPIFRELNVNTNPFNTMDRIGKFFREHGVGTDDFQKAWSSFAVENKLQKADFLNRRYRVESVPTVIVNGKYKTDIGMAGSEAQLFKLIGELAASEHRG